MAKISIRWELGLVYLQYLILAGLVPVLLLGLVGASPGGKAAIEGLFFGKLTSPDIVGLGFFGVLLLCFLGIFLLSGFRIIQILRFRHPSLLQLGRFGPVEAIVKQIDEELAIESELVTIGTLLRSFHAAQPHRSFRATVAPKRVLGPNAVWLTPSWLIYVRHQGTDMQFMRLNSLVMAFRDEMGLLERGAWTAETSSLGSLVTGFQTAAKVVLVDRFDVSHTDQRHRRRLDPIVGGDTCSACRGH